MKRPGTIPVQGLLENRVQFLLLVTVNAFVGAMVGLERAVLPAFGGSAFGLESGKAIMSFILAFGISKAISNYLMARLMRRFTRKQVLVIGWLFALPVPFLLLYARDWNWVVAANLLLGINQGLAWSATVIMKVDLVGPRHRGLAMGINEFAGYLSVGLASFLASAIAARYGYVWYPFLPGLFFLAAGLLLSLLLVRDTTALVQEESAGSTLLVLPRPWTAVSWKHRNIGTVTINGVINNMNDAVVWGLVPVFLLRKGFTVAETGLIAALYPVVWGLLQLVTGAMGDRYCKKQLITAGMWTQSIGIALLALGTSMPLLVIGSVLLGAGTALVYPNFLTVVAEGLHPSQRAEGLGIFRFWRDSGYVVGAVVAGVLADRIGLEAAILFMALLTAGAGALAHVRMCCTLRKFYPSEDCSRSVTQ